MSVVVELESQNLRSQSSQTKGRDEESRSFSDETTGPNTLNSLIYEVVEGDWKYDTQPARSLLILLERPSETEDTRWSVLIEN